MTREGLGQYKGTLTAGQLAAGMNAARANARRLAEDARLLFESERAASALALAILSIEESGKDAILRGMAIARDPAELRSHWKEYRSHTKENRMWILPSLAMSGARTLGELAPIFDPASDHPEVLDQLKQIATYTDCLGEAHWSIPNEVIDSGLTESIVKTAELFSRAEEVTDEEVELWIEHMGPVSDSPLSWRDTALINWHNALVERGLRKNSNMERFVRGPGITRSGDTDESGEK